MQRFALPLIAAAVLGGLNAAADAALVVHVTDAAAAPGASVPVGVYVTNDPADPAGTVNAVNSFGVGLYVDPATVTTTSTGYGFGGSAPTDTGSGYQLSPLLDDTNFTDIGDYMSTGLSVFAVNNLADATAGRSPASGGSGLLQFRFTVPADAVPGTTYTVLIDTNPDITSFAGPASGPDASDVPLLDYTATSATITVTPEPASLATLGGAAVVLLRRRRTR